MHTALTSAVVAATVLFAATLARAQIVTAPSPRQQQAAVPASAPASQPASTAAPTPLRQPARSLSGMSLESLERLRDESFEQARIAEARVSSEARSPERAAQLKADLASYQESIRSGRFVDAAARQRELRWMIAGCKTDLANMRRAITHFNMADAIMGRDPRLGSEPERVLLKAKAQAMQRDLLRLQEVVNHVDSALSRDQLPELATEPMSPQKVQSPMHDPSGAYYLPVPNNASRP